MPSRAKVTSKGQITIPAEIRRQLDLEPGDNVYFTLSKTGVRMAKAGSIVAATKGAFKDYATYPPLSAREMKDMAEEAWAEDSVERSGME
jgi:antitoxin PrlF